MSYSRSAGINRSHAQALFLEENGRETQRAAGSFALLKIRLLVSKSGSSK